MNIKRRPDDTPNIVLPETLLDAAIPGPYRVVLPAWAGTAVCTK